MLESEIEFAVRADGDGGMALLDVSIMPAFRRRVSLR